MNLESIREYCKDKRIVVVGNSSKIIGSGKGRFIDSHDIVIRMNYALPLNKSFIKDIGQKTNIYSVGISRASVVENILRREKRVKYILRLNPHGEKLKHNNAYFLPKDEYSIIKSKFGEFKPSTGSLVAYFLKEHINYKLLNFIGFDFFIYANRLRQNEFRSYKYKDHNSELERKYMVSILNNNTKLINV